MHPESGGWTDTEQKYPPPSGHKSRELTKLHQNKTKTDKNEQKSSRRRR